MFLFKVWTIEGVSKRRKMLWTLSYRMWNNLKNQGRKLCVLFPEGGIYHETVDLMPFKKGAFVAAIESQVYLDTQFYNLDLLIILFRFQYCQLYFFIMTSLTLNIASFYLGKHVFQCWILCQPKDSPLPTLMTSSTELGTKCFKFFNSLPTIPQHTLRTTNKK